LPKRKGKTSEKLSKDRIKRMEELHVIIDHSGKGLLQSQVELKYAPWQVTWERQDMLMERQERIIELLEQILDALKKKK
jgi:hypothetical protein